MKGPTIIIYQGSTPTIELTMPVDISGGGCAVYATISQDDQTVLEYTLGGTPTDPAPEGTLTGDEYDGTLLYLMMAQSDTLALDVGDFELQLRVVTPDGADTFVPVKGWCGRAMKSGVIECPV